MQKERLEKNAYLLLLNLSHDTKSIERVLRVLTLKVTMQKERLEKERCLPSSYIYHMTRRRESIESIDIKIRMQKERLEKERCLPSTLTSINMINEDERWKSIENIDVKMQKERLEKEREKKGDSRGGPS